MAAKQVDNMRKNSGADNTEKRQYQQDLTAIRSMMERSSRFISLSGLWGVAAGLVALIGGFYALFLLHKQGRDYLSHSVMPYSTDFFMQLFILAVIILVLAIAAAGYFTIRKSKRSGLQIWTTTTKQLLINLFIPLLIGGITCLALLYHGQIQLLAPATLIFYGLALINASKYTYQELYYLGILEAMLGLISCFLVGYGLIFWIIGFGLLHITYGILMQRKYR